MQRAQKVLATAAAYVVFGAMLCVCAPPWPDDWDGLGFLASARTFDLDKFAPHPPGYPVYVAALRIAMLIAKRPILAAYGVSIVSGLFSIRLAGRAARRAWGGRAETPAAVAVAITPLAFRAMTAVNTEALALSFAILGVWALTAAREDDRRAPVALGLAVGLGLGVRLSWAPLYLPMLLLTPRPARLRALLTTAFATLAWALPLAWIVGPSHLVKLYQVHGAGHATHWGGTVITDPSASRVTVLMRDLFVDGLGVDRDALGIAVSLIGLTLAVLGALAWRGASFRGAKSCSIVLGPYAVWIMFGQNISQQPRHALPLVVALAVTLSRAAMLARREHVLGGLLAALIAGRTALDARDRRTTPPPGVAFLNFVRASPAPRDVGIFAGPSARFFETTELADHSATVPAVGDAFLMRMRMPSPPSRMLVTSELEDVDKAPRTLLATFCRPARIDRRAPCLAVYELAP